jgi:hypothetical protein
MSSALVGSEWSASRPCRFTPGERDSGTHSIGSWVDPRIGLDDMEKWKFLTIPGLELPPFRRPARIQSLHRLRYRDPTLLHVRNCITLWNYCTHSHRLEMLTDNELNTGGIWSGQKLRTFEGRRPTRSNRVQTQGQYITLTGQISEDIPL